MRTAGLLIVLSAVCFGSPPKLTGDLGFPPGHSSGAVITRKLNDPMELLQELLEKLRVRSCWAVVTYATHATYSMAVSDERRIFQKFFELMCTCCQDVIKRVDRAIEDEELKKVNECFIYFINWIHTKVRLTSRERNKNPETKWSCEKSFWVIQNEKIKIDIWEEAYLLPLFCKKGHLIIRTIKEYWMTQGERKSKFRSNRNAVPR